MGVKQQSYSFYAWKVHVWHKSTKLLLLDAINFLQSHLTASPTAPVTPAGSSLSYCASWAKWESSSMVNNIFSWRTLLLKVVDLRRWKNDMNFNLFSRIPAHPWKFQRPLFYPLDIYPFLDIYLSFLTANFRLLHQTQKAQILVDCLADTHYCVMSNFCNKSLISCFQWFYFFDQILAGIYFSSWFLVRGLLVGINPQGIWPMDFEVVKHW